MADEIEKALSDWNKHYKKTKAWLKKNEERRMFKDFDEVEVSSDHTMWWNDDLCFGHSKLGKRERELLIKRCQRNLAILSEGI